MLAKLVEAGLVEAVYFNERKADFFEGSDFGDGLDELWDAVIGDVFVVEEFEIKI